MVSFSRTVLRITARVARDAVVSVSAPANTFGHSKN